MHNTVVSMGEFSAEIFYADERQCAEWDAQLLAEYPALATTTEEWRTTPGWYWRGLKEIDGVDLEGGPYDTREECVADFCEQSRMFFIPDRAGAIADVLGNAIYGVRGRTPESRH
jgi:hypothetical protein